MWHFASLLSRTLIQKTRRWQKETLFNVSAWKRQRRMSFDSWTFLQVVVKAPSIIHTTSRSQGPGFSNLISPSTIPIRWTRKSKVMGASHWWSLPHAAGTRWGLWLKPPLSMLGGAWTRHVCVMQRLRYKRMVCLSFSFRLFFTLLSDLSTCLSVHLYTTCTRISVLYSIHSFKVTTTRPFFESISYFTKNHSKCNSLLSFSPPQWQPSHTLNHQLSWSNKPSSQHAV